ncbi:LLM class flavin-dependent oxidoreductase [Actinomadura parmotrematis]|uniref:LLM class flavin-dependent oxidoreductase n=1 Tax=Actinomadura parmotrematis TaxID=2864039 RepID=A0ABS7G0J7_9ACTN|nr:LLM class flavin-dependent oxidoreductase [Actinomadura parmotrematis]MBW8485394.1 LLM class flavin-dependent oxidoreductase [Actinomadura parmotrematis]
MPDQHVTFGVKTTPMRAGYQEILRVWQEADERPELADAWLWDHLTALGPDPAAPVLEGWTLLAALAARTERLGLGLLVTSNRIREPAVLGKIATTVDVISGGRLVMGLGVGGTRQPPGTGGIPGPNPAVAEYAAYGLDLVPPGEGVERLAETIAILKGMWTEEVLDFAGRHYTLTGNRNEPKPVRPGGPPLLLGGWGTRVLRLVAEHADAWNVPGPPHNDVAWIAGRARVLDAHCADIGRDPAEIARSVQYIVDTADAAGTRAAVAELIAAGMTHIVLSLRPPYPPGAVAWLVEEVVRPAREG